MQIPITVRLALVFGAALCLANCAAPATHTAGGKAAGRRISHVRTTAYCGSEGSGKHNATGEYLSGRHVRSAASDWSRYPLGTRFRVVGMDDEYVIDDYGTALIGTNTIDLYKPSRAEMRTWGVRHVDIDVLQWGSHEQSLKVLRPRKRSGMVRRMIASIESKKS
jgi:3D (Asp-Asp-Asp) domain-containing protein